MAAEFCIDFGPDGTRTQLRTEGKQHCTFSGFGFLTKGPLSTNNLGCELCSETAPTGERWPTGPFPNQLQALFRASSCISGTSSATTKTRGDVQQYRRGDLHFWLPAFSHVFPGVSVGLNATQSLERSLVPEQN